MRQLYLFVLDLHPTDFCADYFDELLWIFDEEAARGASKLLLVVDLVISLARQWIVRRALWKWAVGVFIGALEVAVTLTAVFSAGHVR